MSSAFALPALLAALTLQQGEPGTVSGTVSRELGDGGSEPLPHALVEVRNAGRAMTVVADSAGRYVLRRVPEGRRRVRAIHVGYESLEVEVLVPAGDTVSVDFDLAARPVSNPPLLVEVRPFRLPADTLPPPTRSPPELAEAELRSLEFGSGMVETGLASVARAALGGDGAVEDPRAVLFMRGSSAEQKMVLLDGAPLVAPFHVGGLLRAFDPGILGGASLYVGGAPARYDGGLAYILELETRAPRRDRLRSSGTVDLLSAEGTVEGSLGGGLGAMAGLRTLHGAGTGVLGGGVLPYGYEDVVARLGWSDGGDHALAATGFWNRESVELGGDGEDGAAPLPGAVRWGNSAGSLRYEGRLGGTALDVTAAVSRYRASLPLRGSTPLFAEGTTDRLRIVADLSTPALGGTLHWGASVLGTDVGAGIRRLSGAPLEISDDVSGTVVGGHLEGVWSLGPQVRLRTGVRADRFSTAGGVRLAPRMAVAWLLSEDAVLTVAGGRYHQYLQSTETGTLVAMADTSGATEPSAILALPVASASHLTVALDQQLTSVVRLGVEGWLKRFSGVSGGGDRTVSASGLDLRVAARGERLSGWLGYSLTWAWSARGNEVASREFVGRHLLSAGLHGRLGSRVDLDLQGSYGAGLPFGGVPVGVEPESDLGGGSFPDQMSADGDLPLATGLPQDFLRLDARLSTSWRARIGGRPVEIRPYVKVLNALPRRDALFYYFEPWRDSTVRPVAELGLLPLVGLEWVF